MENVLEEVGWLKVNNVYVKKVKSVKVSDIQGVTLSSVRRPSWVTAVSSFVSCSIIFLLKSNCTFKSMLCVSIKQKWKFIPFFSPQWCHYYQICTCFKKDLSPLLLQKNIQSKNLYFPHWMHLQDASFDSWKRVLMYLNGGGTLFI